MRSIELSGFARFFDGAIIRLFHKTIYARKFKIKFSVFTT